MKSGGELIATRESPLRHIQAEEEPHAQSAAGRKNEMVVGYLAIGVGAALAGTSIYKLASNDYDNKSTLTLTGDALLSSSVLLFGASSAAVGAHFAEGERGFKAASLGLAGAGLTTAAAWAVVSSFDNDTSAAELILKRLGALGALALAGLAFYALQRELDRVEVAVQVETFLIAAPF